MPNSANNPHWNITLERVRPEGRTLFFIDTDHCTHVRSYNLAAIAGIAVSFVSMLICS